MEIHTETAWHERLQDEGTWDRVKGKIREQWGDLTDDEVEQARGNFEQFSGRVKQVTGDTAENIQRKFEEWTS
ncbi:MAG TPA: CsbD family protein [Acidimicrobiia bacterium]|nr:CsbD family protein [Acidimicrobiia bacterium]